MPFSGTVHRLYWNQTGTCSTATIKLYLNSNNETSTPTSPIQQFSNFTLNSRGQLLYSQDITI